MRKLIQVWFLSLLILGCAFGQTKDVTENDDDVVRIDTQLIEVPLLVTDKNGKPLLNLNKNNFVVYENGVKQEINNFGSTNAPFEVALLLDTSGSTRNDLALIQKAAENFIKSLRLGDKVSIISFNSKISGNKSTAVPEVLTPLTNDRTKLNEALRKVAVSNGTPYYQSLSTILDEVFVEQPQEEFRGRRALVALTDGVDSVSEIEFNEIKERFHQSGIVCFFIQVDTRDFFEDNLLGDCETGDVLRLSQTQIKRYYRVFYPKSKIEKELNFCKIGDFERLDISKSLYQLADMEMQYLSKKSGGKIFPVSFLSEANSAFQKVAQEIGTKYSLGYYSSNEKRDGTYRTIKVELKNVPVGTQVRAREGYKAPKN